MTDYQRGKQVGYRRGVFDAENIIRRFQRYYPDSLFPACPPPTATTEVKAIGIVKRMLEDVEAEVQKLRH